MNENNTKKILVVEDDQLLLSILAKQLTDKGYIVVTAENGEEGIKKFFDEKPNAVILDVLMPKKDGVQMLKEIHEKVPHDTTPMIVLSNSNDIDHIANAMANKAIAYLVKSDQQLDDIANLLEKKLNPELG